MTQASELQCHSSTLQLHVVGGGEGARAAGVMTGIPLRHGPELRGAEQQR